MTWKDILESLTIDDVERFLYSLGVNYIRHEGADTLICPTICHNPIDEQGSMKLYWYQKNKTFHCYTECNENMSIFELYMKYCAINYGPITFMEAELYIKQFLSNIESNNPEFFKSLKNAFSHLHANSFCDKRYLDNKTN